MRVSGQPCRRNATCARSRFLCAELGDSQLVAGLHPFRAGSDICEDADDAPQFVERGSARRFIEALQVAFHFHIEAGSTGGEVSGKSFYGLRGRPDIFTLPSMRARLSGVRYASSCFCILRLKRPLLAGSRKKRASSPLGITDKRHH